MDWQETTALAITAVTAGLFAWARWRPRKFNFARDTHCGCAPGAKDQTRSSIVYHARKGGRREVIVRMR